MLDILKKYLIFETVEQELTDAINNRNTISLYYSGNKGKSKNPRDDHNHTDSGLRYVIPVALGLHKSSGSLVLRGLVTSKGVHTKNSDGGIKRNRPTKWRMFRVDRIASVYPHEDAAAINALYDKTNGNLYHDNDRDMSIVYAQMGPDNKKPVAPEPEQVQVSIPSVPDVENTPTDRPPEINTEPDNMVLPQRHSDNIEIEKPEIPIEPEEEIEPEDEDQPINEWYKWLNKLLTIN